MKGSIVSNYFFVEDTNLCSDFLGDHSEYFAEPRGIKKDNFCKWLLIELQKQSILVRLNIPEANGNDPDKLWSIAELEDAHLIFGKVMMKQG